MTYLETVLFILVVILLFPVILVGTCVIFIMERWSERNKGRRGV